MQRRGRDQTQQAGHNPTSIVRNRGLKTKDQMSPLAVLRPSAGYGDLLKAIAMVVDRRTPKQHSFNCAIIHPLDSALEGNTIATRDYHNR